MNIPTFQDQLDLVSAGLARAHINDNLTTFKYARKVMYDNLWNTNPHLLECRGHVYDNSTGNLVNLPMFKTFNYLENSAFSNIPLTDKVSLYWKLNGFMAAASKYNGELIVSTTGTTNSEYAVWAREQILKTNPLFDNADINDQFTNLYEIVIPEDPHIVDCSIGYGAHLLGQRSLQTGNWFPNSLHFADVTLDKAVNQLAKRALGVEGWMVYWNPQDNPETAERLNLTETQVCKVKTDYYKGKKRLMRMNDRDVVSMFGMRDDKVPDLWRPIVPRIVDNFTIDEWCGKDAQQRRAILEEFMGE